MYINGSIVCRLYKNITSMEGGGYDEENLSCF